VQGFSFVALSGHYLFISVHKKVHTVIVAVAKYFDLETAWHEYHEVYVRRS